MTAISTTTFPGSGLTLTADVAGNAHDPAVLLFHGGGQTRHSWGTTVRSLAAAGFFVASVDLRGHGESDWSPTGDYRLDAFADDVTSVSRRFERPVLVGASLGGVASLAACGRAVNADLARGLVVVDVGPHIEIEGANRIGNFMAEHLESGFATLDEVADAIQRYNPHRPRPGNLDGLRKNLRHRDGRWYWHWDPAFITGKMGSTDETRITTDGFGGQRAMLEAAARAIRIPTMLVRGRESDLLSEQGAKDFLELVPHAEYVDVAGAGHMVAGDRNDVFNDAIVGFVTRLG